MPEPVPAAASDLAAAAGGTPTSPLGAVPPDPADAAATLPPGTPPVAASPPPPASRRTIFKNFAGVAGIGLISRVIGIAVDVFIRRTLGPGVVGMVDWNSAALAYASATSNPGLQTVARRDAARDPGRIAELMVGTTILQACPLLVVVLACIACHLAGWRTGMAGQLLVCQAVMVAIATIQPRWAFEAVDRYLIVNVFGLLMLAFVGLSAPFLLRSPDDGLRYGVLQLVGTTMITAMSFGVAFRDGLISPAALRDGARRVVHQWRPMYHDALPITLASLSTTIYSNGVALILGPTHGDRAVGLYSTAYALMMLGTVPAATLQTVFFASFARADPHRPEAAAGVSTDYLRGLLLVTAPTSLLGWAVGRHALEFVYGPSFAVVGTYFEWLCLVLIVIGIRTGLASPLIAWGQNRAYLRLSMLGAVANLLIGLVLVPLYGVAGAVATTLAGELVVLIASLPVRAKLVPPPYRRVLAPLPAMIVVAIVTRYASATWPHAWFAVLAAGGLGMLAVTAHYSRAIIARGLKRFPS